jgi:hypothetical protein
VFEHLQQQSHVERAWLERQILCFALKQEALRITYAKIAKYNAECSVFRHKHGISFSRAEMKSKKKGKEDFELDDDYLD